MEKMGADPKILTEASLNICYGLKIRLERFRADHRTIPEPIYFRMDFDKRESSNELPHVMA